MLAPEGVILTIALVVAGAFSAPGYLARLGSQASGSAAAVAAGAGVVFIYGHWPRGCFCPA